MKRTFFLIAILLLSLQLASAQPAAPTSRVIDAAQMLLDLKTLSTDDMQGRAVGSPGGLKAREYVLEQFKKSGLEALADSYLQPFEFTNRRNEKIQGTNVVGCIRGKKTPERYIVVTAHYDHIGTRNNVVFNGADDNASGTAALFALAKYFKKNPPANSIIFVALDAEEAGLHGAKKFVAAPPVKKESIVLNVNMDMVSHSDANELYAVGASQYPFLKPYLQGVAKNAPIKLLFGHEPPSATGEDDWTSQSDHFAFHQAQIPFVYFGVEDHKDYHQPTDDFATINQKFYVGAVETILASLKKFDGGLAQIEKQKILLTSGKN